LVDTMNPMIAPCPNPGCAEPIRQDHPYPWCTACGERFPESLQRKLLKVHEGKARAQAAREGLLSEPEIVAACGNCRVHFKASSRRDGLGFLDLTCPYCHHTTTLPLRWGTRITYWVFQGLSLWGVILMSRQKDSRFSGLFVLNGLLLRAILKDLKIIYDRWTRNRKLQLQSGRGVP
jgi:hypothetical protein